MVSLCQYKLKKYNIPNASGLRTTIPVRSRQVRNNLSHTVILQDNDKKVEKKIKIQRVAVQLTDGAGQNLRAH